MNDTSWIDREEYPFAPHRFEVSAGSLHYVDEGDGQPHPPQRYTISGAMKYQFP